MLNLVGRQIDYPINFDIHKGSTRDDLVEFGKKIADGAYSLGVVWGIEFGWLEQLHPGLKVLLVCVGGKRISKELRYQLLVRRKDKIADLKSLKGKHLAHYEREGLMGRLVLDDMLKNSKQDPKGFFADNKPVPMVRSAIYSVLDGDADCVFVDATNYIRLKQAFPRLAQNLATLCESDSCPEVALIGCPDTLNKLRGGLWDRLQGRLLRVHDTAEGKEAVKYWNIDSFILPDEDYHERVKKWVRRIPLSSLPSRK